MQKIKKLIPIKPVKNCSKPQDLISFVKNNNKPEVRKKRSTDLKIDRSAPSKLPTLIYWKNKKNIEDWSGYDFLGFYLNKYLEIIGEEDINFIGRDCKEKFYKEYRLIHECLKTFFKNKEEFKSYIEFIIDWWMKDDSFPDGLPSVYSIFSQKGFFVKEYKSSLIKKKSKRKDLDNNFADKNQWDKYFGGK